MNNKNFIKDFIADITSPPYIPYGRIEDGVIKDVVVLCDLIGVKQNPIGMVYSFRLPNGDIFEMSSFEYRTMTARHKELMEVKI